MKTTTVMVLVLAIGIVFFASKSAAQSDKYSKMVPVAQYLVERNAEILLARSAALDSISSDATILILGRQGYETAVRGKNSQAFPTTSHSLPRLASREARTSSDHLSRNEK